MEKLPENKNRLDKEMLERGLVRSRSSAQDYIDRGNVKLNGTVITKSSTMVSSSDKIEVSNVSKFVSRAGDKLEAALDAWKIDLSGLIAIDVGSSTGGFTDCLLQHGVEKVIAVDVGTDQLVEKLRNDPRVELHESTDVRKFSTSTVDVAVVDVSFISLSLVLPKVFEFIKTGRTKKTAGRAIFLVKPQFEVGRELAQKRNGIIRDEKERLATLESIKTCAKKIGFKVIANIDSPIEGENGNREFLLLLEKSG